MEDKHKYDESYEFANEYMVLFESQNELIILHRNMLHSEEFVVMTTNLIDQDYADNKLWCKMVDYHHLLPYRFKIQQYQCEKDNLRLFEAFFKMSIEQFFRSISNPSEL